MMTKFKYIGKSLEYDKLKSISESINFLSKDRFLVWFKDGYVIYNLSGYDKKLKRYIYKKEIWGYNKKGLYTILNKEDFKK